MLFCFAIYLALWRYWVYMWSLRSQSSPAISPTPSVSPHPLALRVKQEQSGHSRALLARIAGRRRQRRAAGVVVGCRVGSLGLVTVVGGLPGCEALDLLFQILALGSSELSSSSFGWDRGRRRCPPHR